MKMDKSIGTIIVCHRGVRSVDVGGTETKCEICQFEVAAWKVSVERARRDPNTHILCRECFAEVGEARMMAGREIFYGGRIGAHSQWGPE